MNSSENKPQRVPQYAFSARKEYSGTFAILKLAIHRIAGNGEYSIELLGLQWQMDLGSASPPQWYGMRFQFGPGSEQSFEYAEEALKLLRRLFRGGQYSVGIEEVLSRLSKFAHQVLYDPRQGRHVTHDALLPPEYQRFVPEHLRLGWSSVITECIARTVSEAQEMIAASLVSTGHHGSYVEFHKAGRPVTVAINSRAPRWQDIGELVGEV